jgi:transposase-like protein
MVSTIQSQLSGNDRDCPGAGCPGGTVHDITLGSGVFRSVQSALAALERPLGRSWRCDETYLKVGGVWMYLYRAVDELGRTVASHLSRTRDKKAAKAFFRKALKQHGEPRTITLDGFEPSHSAPRIMGMRNEFNFCWEDPVKIRCCQYLDNLIERDHRRIKFRTQPMLGFKTFYNARRVPMGVELMQKIVKDQFRVPASFGRSAHSIWQAVLAQ